MKKYLTLLYGFSLVIMIASCGSSAPKLETISLDKEDMTITPGEKYNFKLELTPTDIEIEDIQLEWESSDTDVVTVSDGKIVGKSDGTAVVTVSNSEGITASCFVTVKTPSAYDKLTSADKKVYNIVIDFSSDLKSPSSVSVKGVYNVNKELLVNGGWYDYVIEISAMNGFGGYSMGYLDWDGNSSFNYSSNAPIVTGEISQYNIGRINDAIEEHFSK